MAGENLPIGKVPTGGKSRNLLCEAQKDTMPQNKFGLI